MCDFGQQLRVTEHINGVLVVKEGSGVGE